LGAMSDFVIFDLFLKNMAGFFSVRIVTNKFSCAPERFYLSVQAPGCKQDPSGHVIVQDNYID
jgi:hypothetical protein